MFYVECSRRFYLQEEPVTSVVIVTLSEEEFSGNTQLSRFYTIPELAEQS